MKRAHRLLTLLLIGLLGWSCESKHSWEGRYTEQPGQGAAATVNWAAVRRQGAVDGRTGKHPFALGGTQRRPVAAP